MTKELGLGDDTPVFGAAAIGKLIGKSERTAREWCESGLLPAVRLVARGPPPFDSYAITFAEHRCNDRNLLATDRPPDPAEGEVST